MTLEEHNRELKRRLLFCVAMFVLFFGVAYYFNKDILKFILSLGEDVGYKYIALTPQEVFVQTLRVSGVIAILTSAPVFFTQIVIFIAPIFEKKKTAVCLYILGIIAIIMVVAGMIFSIKILLPFTVKYLFNFGQGYNVTNQISFEKFLSFFITITIALGVVFLMPIFSAILGKLGFVTEESMKKAFPIIIVLILIISALITPPDVISQCIVALPVTLLYGISMLIVKLLRRNNE